MSIDMDALLREHQRLTSKGQGGGGFMNNFVKMPEGSGWVVVRILPPGEGQTLPFLTTRMHKINDRNLYCLRSLSSGQWLGNCPICDYYNYLWREADKKGEGPEGDALRHEARSLKPLERTYYNAVVRESDPSTGQSEADGPLILSVGKQLQTIVLKAMLGNPALRIKALGNVTDVETGRDFQIIKKVTKSGADNFPSYNDSYFLDVSPSGNSDQISAWLAKRHDLFALRQLKSEADLKKEIRIHRGMEQDPRVSFNPEEFALPSSRPTVTEVRSEVITAPTPRVEVADVADVDDDFGVESDFIADLKKLASK